MGWKTYGKVSLMNDGPFERNPHYVRLSDPGHAHKHTGLDNEGFFGIGVKKGEEYRFSVWARLPQGSTKETLRIELVDTQSMGERQALVAGNLTIDSKDWKKYQMILKPGSTHPKSVLRIFLTSKGTVDLEHVSLFPVDTWKGHENGLRKDLAQALADIHPAIRKAYPDIKIIGSSGPDSEGKQFEYLWPEMKRLKVDLVDEHFYRPENWFLNEGARYDNYDRKGPKVFAGEYACHGKGKKWNHFNAALLEAAFMTGLERNADIVHMATYAPLFAHVEGWQWRPDMIWFDNLNSVRTVSYYVQQLYGHHKGTNVLSLTMNKKPVTGAEDQNGLFASAVYDKDKSEIIVKVANTSDKVQPLSLKFEGLKKQDVLSDGRCIKLRSADLDKDNTIEQPFAIQPQETPVSIDGQVLNVELEPKTFVVYIFKKG